MDFSLDARVLLLGDIWNINGDMKKYRFEFL